MKLEPVDPDINALLSEPGPSPAPPETEVVSAAEMAVEDLRQGMRDAMEIFTRGAAPVPLHRVRDELVPGRGGPVPVRVYSPETPSAVIAYFHGGAWVAGDLDTHDLVTRRLSRDTGAVVVSVDYRMLPEHPFPAPLDDAFDAAAWASALRPDLPLLVAGDSAGGTLAACVALRARDEDGPRFDGQVLVYAAIDDDLETPSMLAFAEGPHLTRDDIGHFIRQYGCDEAALGSPYALPGRARTLAGLPPAVVVVAGHDLLRSAEEEYARRLSEAEVPVTVQLDLELTHGWLEFSSPVPSADRAFTRLTDSINDLVHRAAAPAPL